MRHNLLAQAEKLPDRPSLRLRLQRAPPRRGRGAERRDTLPVRLQREEKGEVTCPRMMPDACHLTRGRPLALFHRDDKGLQSAVVLRQSEAGPRHLLENFL